MCFRVPCSHFVMAYFETGLLYFFLQASWESLLAWPGKWQYFHSVQHGFRQQNLALILELSKLLKQELNQMPRSPPKTQTKPVLRFRDVWITLNKTMLYFYRSCFQLSLQAEIQKKSMAGRSISALFLAQLKSGSSGNLTKTALSDRLSNPEVLLLLPTIIYLI